MIVNIEGCGRGWGVVAEQSPLQCGDVEADVQAANSQEEVMSVPGGRALPRLSLSGMRSCCLYRHTERNASVVYRPCNSLVSVLSDASQCLECCLYRLLWDSRIGCCDTIVE